MKRGSGIHGIEIEQVLLQFTASVFSGELVVKHLLAYHSFVNLQGSSLELVSDFELVSFSLSTSACCF